MNRFFSLSLWTWNMNIFASMVQLMNSNLLSIRDSITCDCLPITSAGDKISWGSRRESNAWIWLSAIDFLLLLSPRQFFLFEHHFRAEFNREKKPASFLSVFFLVEHSLRWLQRDAFKQNIKVKRGNTRLHLKITESVSSSPLIGVGQLYNPSCSPP